MFTLEKKALAILKIANAFAYEIIKYNETNNGNTVEARAYKPAWQPKVKETPPTESDNGASAVGDGVFQ